MTTLAIGYLVIVGLAIILAIPMFLKDIVSKSRESRSKMPVPHPAPHLWMKIEDAFATHDQPHCFIRGHILEGFVTPGQWIRIESEDARRTARVLAVFSDDEVREIAVAGDGDQFVILLVEGIRVGEVDLSADITHD